MTFISSLRGRITVAFFLASVGLSAVLLLTVDFFSEDMETAYLSAHLDENMHLMLDNARANADFRPPYSEKMKGYVYVRAQQQPPAPELIDLSPGYQEFDTDNRELHILVVDDGDKRYVLVYDGESFEVVEETLAFWLLIGVLVMITLITLAGYWMSAQIAQPITNLADAIESLDGSAPLLDMAAGSVVPGEVEKLRRAFHDYSVRLAAFIERERNFTADVSHELRNPVMAATSALDLLEARADFNLKTVRQIARVRRSVSRMQNLIELFLNLSRESKAATIALAFDVSALVEDATVRYAEVAHSKGLVLNLDVREHPEGRGDSTMAAVVLENIISNAVHYTLSGTVDVVVGDGGVSITDSGPGIAESELETVLKRLQRGSVGNGSTVAGFGLGLSIVSRICEHQGWKFDLQSLPGRGTRAFIAFA